ncbi:hypothetical protein [Nostoc sp.]|uniref:hypothetical protein n=1 Tax=Nostoc sp. TaxID=1180 RepID=UPI002FFCBDF0
MITQELLGELQGVENCNFFGSANPINADLNLTTHHVLILARSGHILLSAQPKSNCVIILPSAVQEME